MISIIANNTAPKQFIFESYNETSEYFGISFSKIKRAIENGLPVMTRYGAYWFDILEE